MTSSVTRRSAEGATDLEIAVLVDEDVARFLGGRWVRRDAQAERQTYKISVDDAGRVDVLETSLKVK